MTLEVYLLFLPHPPYVSLFRECIHGAVLRTIGRCGPSLEGLGPGGLVRFNDKREDRLYTNAMEKHGPEDARRLTCSVF